MHQSFKSSSFLSDNMRWKCKYGFTIIILFEEMNFIINTSCCYSIIATPLGYAKK